MSYHDRGTIKWSSLMLPEHKERLSAWYKEQDYEAKPELDEQQREEINRTLMEALEENRELEVTFYQGHHFHKEKGHIGKFARGRAIQVVRASGDGIWIDVRDITDVQ
ncbi:MAG TPA: YolD-like family protein [Bacillales bacterium]|nr:YolD-like family protein [Bacillales bacterium]